MSALGKLPFKDDPSDLRLADFTSSIAGIEGDFGHESLISDWGMLGNDTAGDCVWAGSAHETMLLGTEGGHHPAFSTESVIGDYSAATGYVAGDPSTDRGTEVRVAMKYRQKTGIADAKGGRHHIGAYLRIDPKDPELLMRCAYTFGAVGIGIEFPDTAMSQFAQGEPWEVVAGSKIEGGHYVPVVARRGGMPVCVTWGRTQRLTPAFYGAFCDEAWVYVSSSALGPEGKTPDGFDKAGLLEALAALKVKS